MRVNYEQNLEHPASYCINSVFFGGGVYGGSITTDDTGAAMTKTALLITAQMLELSANEFSDHTCNDYELENTAETFEFVQQMIAASDYPEDEIEFSHSNKIMVMDTEVMRYCIALLRWEAAKL